MGFEKFFICVALVLLVWLETQTIKCTALEPSDKTDQDLSTLFEAWASKHKRKYATPEEKERRFQNFRATHEFIENFDKEGKKLYTVGLNAFADMTDAEFFDAYTCYSESSNIDSSIAAHNVYADNKQEAGQDFCPGDIDFTTDGLVTAPRSQGKCGSCWAFAAVAAVEILRRQTYGRNNVIPLSTQQIVSCDKNSNGCNGTRNAANPFKYILENGGLSSDVDYPYTAKTGECESNQHPLDPQSSISGYMHVLTKTETVLHHVLCNEGPAIATIAANSSDFKNYKGGIFHDECGPKANHIVTVVGSRVNYPGQQNYFKILNSWGPGWGENGYMRIIRAEIPGGYCGIANGVVFPMLD